MSFNQVFADYYQKLCLIVNEQPGVMQAQTMMEYLKEEVVDEELILKGMKAASQIQNKKVRVYTDKNGHTSEVPRLPSSIEVVEICLDLKGKHLQEKAEKESLLMLSQPREISEQAKANGQLACSLVSWFKCCPDRVYSLIDAGTLKADLSLASHNFFAYYGKENINNQTRPIAMRNFIQSTYADVIEVCQK